MHFESLGDRILWSCVILLYGFALYDYGKFRWFRLSNHPEHLYLFRGIEGTFLTENHNISYLVLKLRSSLEIRMALTNMEPIFDKFQKSDLASPWVRIGAGCVDIFLFFLTLIIGYLIWSIILLKHAQTPGMQLFSLRYIDLESGRKASVKTMFLMIMIAFGITILLAPFTAGFSDIINIILVLPIFFTEYNQSAYDKMLNVTIVRDSDGRYRE